MRRYSLLALGVSLGILAVCIGMALNRVRRADTQWPAATNAEEDKPDLAAAADELLRDEPMTIVFRRLNGHGLDPWRWYWSINSAGDGELTINSIPVRRKLALSAEQMAAIRHALRAERFVTLKDSYGPSYVDQGWDTLTVIAGEHINKSVRFNSVWRWAKERKTLDDAVPAARIWLTVVEILDPDGNVFTERKELAAAILALKR